MTPNQTERLRKLVEAGVVEWMPGMLFIADNGTPMRVLAFDAGADTHHIELAGVWGNQRGWYSPRGGVPDITDPATRGCLLEQLRERCQDDALHVRGMKPYQPRMDGSHNSATWLVCDAHGRVAHRGETEAGAILAAFEALP